MAGSAGKRIAVTAESSRIVVHALHVYADPLARPRVEHYTFTLDIYDDRGSIIGTMAQCSGLLVARAACTQTLIKRPSLTVTFVKESASSKNARLKGALRSPIVTGKSADITNA